MLSAQCYPATPDEQSVDRNGAFTSHVGIHAPSTRTMRMPVSSMGVPMSTMAVPVTPMAVLSVAVPMMRVPVVVARAAALGCAVGVGVTEGTDAHQVDEETAN